MPYSNPETNTPLSVLYSRRFAIEITTFHHVLRTNDAVFRANSFVFLFQKRSCSFISVGIASSRQVLATPNNLA